MDKIVQRDSFCELNFKGSLDTQNCLEQQTTTTKNHFNS